MKDEVLEKDLSRMEGVELEYCGKLKCRSSWELPSCSRVSIGFECLDRELFDPEACYGKLGRAGVKWARCQTGWNRCEKERGTYDFAWLDEIVDKLLAEGIQSWFNVGFGNPLYMEETYSEAAVGCVPLYYGEETVRAWENYVSALARHFRGRVRFYEIWNEPNLPAFWQPRDPDPEEYACLVRLTGMRIREEDPSARIGACVSGGNSWYTQHFLRSGIASFLDFFSIHPYSVQPELNCAETAKALRSTLDSCGASHVELWQGECGFASWFPENHWLPPYVRESERNQAAWLLRRYVADFAAGISLSSFFQTVDMMLKDYKLGNETRKQPARHGILNGITYTEKLSFHAMRHIANIFSSPMPLRGGGAFCAVSLDRAFPRSERHSRLMDAAVFKAVFEKNSYPVFVYYLAEDVQYGFPGIGNVFVQASPGRDGVSYGVVVPGADSVSVIRNPVLLDLMTGKVYRVKHFQAGDPLFWLEFHSLPLTDYPLMISDLSAFELEDEGKA